MNVEVTRGEDTTPEHLVPNADWTKGGYITADPEITKLRREAEDDLIVVGSGNSFQLVGLYD